MTERDTASLQQDLAELRHRVTQLEAELDAAQESKGRDWAPGYYLSYYAVSGFFLGMVGAVASLLFNMAGASLAGLHPLHLIRVYLTFGMGEEALKLQLDKDGGLTMIIGCCLYIATGMVLGSVFQVVLSSTADKEGLPKRLIVSGALAIAVWIVNYYLLISWLQPAMFGGNWIVTLVPWWVAALTHLVFGWTMALVYPWGRFEPYRVRTE